MEYIDDYYKPTKEELERDQKRREALKKGKKQEKEMVEYIDYWRRHWER